MGQVRVSSVIIRLQKDTYDLCCRFFCKVGIDLTGACLGHVESPGQFLIAKNLFHGPFPRMIDKRKRFDGKK